ncbi:DNA polymerase III subunit gamma/tau [Candidatus Pelagibacter sp.]|nr:DNA polymerase III subunit gamma/tau [Candidatus Pelagibacter sp.]
MTIKSQVLALKYRPQTFKDLIGHEEIATTIYNSIKNNSSANAYLFTGIRGIGKTTFARIVAKALNCEQALEGKCEKKCSHCESIADSNHIDVLEIDAASKTGVDDVRELIEFSRYPPTVAKFKIFIIDEVHMLSKQAFNALLKTLEEPPKYLKFIFATTEVKKIPITVISRCQRYDLSRVKSEELFVYLKDITIKEEKDVEDNAIKLIVKLSEGSVRDALSLLDRATISINENRLTFKDAQKIFGYVYRSSYIDLLEIIFSGDQEKIIDHYRKLYNSGIEPNLFLNDFLEMLYYIKNISHIENEGNNFTLNDNDHKKITSLSKAIEPNDILLFWEFTLKTLKEINIVANPNLLIEMFLIQLAYLKKKKVIENNKQNKLSNDLIKNVDLKNTRIKEPINQIKNIKQEDEKIERKKTIEIKNFEDLIEICLEKKEMKLKYELENNVNLVSFTNMNIEISFNDKLNKNFIKELSEKLYDWTKKRWFISFSKEKGEMSEKEKKHNLKKKNITEYKSSSEYKNLLKVFPDIELTDIEKKDD